MLVEGKQSSFLVECRKELVWLLGAMRSRPVQFPLETLSLYFRLLRDVDAYLSWSRVRRTCWIWKKQIGWALHVLGKKSKNTIKWFQGEDGRDRLKVGAGIVAAIAAVVAAWIAVR